MSYFSSDTSPEIEALMIEGIRAMPPTQRIARLAQLNTLQRRFMLAGLRDRFPEASPEALRRRLADLLLGAELAEKAFGPLPEND